MNMSLNMEINGIINFQIAFDVYDKERSTPHNALISNNLLYLDGSNTDIKVEVNNLPSLEIKNNFLFVDGEKTEYSVDYLPKVIMDRKTLRVNTFSKVFQNFKNPNVTIKSGNIYLDGIFTGKFLTRHGISDISDKFGDLNESEGRY